MESASGPATGRQCPSRGLFWGLIIAVVVLAAAVAACSDDETVTVPDLVGLEETEARDALSDADLALGDVERLALENDATEIGTVISQAPSPGSEVDAGTEVALVIAESIEEAIEEETENPPAADGGSGSGGGSGADPTPNPTPRTTTLTRHRRIAVPDGQGRGTHYSDTFTTTGSRLVLAVTLSTSSGASLSHFVLSSPGGASQSRTIPPTPTATDHTHEWSQPAGSYFLRVIGAESVSWRFSLSEIVEEEIEVPVPNEGRDP